METVESFYHINQKIVNFNEFKIFVISTKLFCIIRGHSSNKCEIDSSIVFAIL